MIEPMAFWKAAFDGCTALLLTCWPSTSPSPSRFLDVEDFIWFDWYQLIWFSVDIFLSFCSPYENEEGWVTNPKWIAAGSDFFELVLGTMSAPSDFPALRMGPYWRVGRAARPGHLRAATQDASFNKSAARRSR